MRFGLSSKPVHFLRTLNWRFWKTSSRLKVHLLENSTLLCACIQDPRVFGLSLFV